MAIFKILAVAASLCLYCFAAPPLYPPSTAPALPLPNSWSPNISTQSNSTISQLFKPPPNLPAENSLYSISHSDETLKLWDYGLPLPELAVRGIIQAAERDAAVNIKSRARMTTTAFVYEGRGHLRLVIHVKPAMTWEVFATMVRGLKTWFQRYGYVACDFNVGQIGYDDMFGTGALTGFGAGVAVE